MIIGTINRQRLTLRSEKIVADSINYITALFSFSDDWEGASKVAHFRKGDTVYDIVLTDDGIWENDHLNLSEGAWEVYLHGNRDGQRITTDVQQLRAYRTGVLNGEPLPEIPLSAAEQILNKASEAERTAQSVRDDADAGKFNGRDYDHSDEFQRLHDEMQDYQQQVQTDRAAIEDAVGTAQQAASDADRSAGAAGDSETNARNSAEGAAQSATQAGNAADKAGEMLDAVNAAGAAQVKAIEDKGAEVIESIQEDYTEIEEDLAQKLTEPANMAVGKYFRIAAIDENGHAVLEAVDAPSGDITDVQANGVSVVVDGIAKIVTNEEHGVITTGNSIGLSGATVTDINNRRSPPYMFKPLTLRRLDYAVKSALCDSQEEWSGEDKSSARKQIGILPVTQEDYDLLPTKDANTIYLIVDGD